MIVSETYKNYIYYATEYFVVTQVDNGEHVEGLHISKDGTCPVKWPIDHIKGKFPYMVFSPSERLR